MRPDERKVIKILSFVQQQYVMKLIAELQDPDQTVIYVVNPIEETSQDELMKCQDIEDKFALQSHQVNTNHIVKNGQGEILMVYRPNHHEENVVKTIADALHAFSMSKKLKVPSEDI